MSAAEEADRAQRAAADPGASVFVTANAGSGKTKVLIDRIARLLLAGASPSSFLCITYTKAAAAEMQRRLFERLGRWSVLPDAALAEELAQLGEPEAGAALARARALFARALETPGGLKIQTIHAFCERLIARFPLEADVAPGFAIADEALSRALLKEAWAGLVAGPADEALLRFAARHDGERFEALTRALTKQTPAIAAAVAQAGSLEAAHARIRVRHGVTRSREALIAAVAAQTPWDVFGEAAIALAAGAQSDQELAQHIAPAAAARDVEALIAALHTKAGTPRKTLGTKAVRTTHAWIAALFDGPPGQRLIEAAAELKRIALADDGCAALTLAHAAGAAYAAAKTQRGALDFDDLIAAARRLLRESASAAWVLYKLDGGIDHILIDEGQDTSPDQWALIEPLQEEFFAGAGARTAVRTVFAVGDPKQSIYSFQGADPERFRTEAQILAARAASAERAFAAPDLRVSFRSAPEVLQAVDATFEDLGVRPQDPFIGMRHIAHRRAQAGLVEVWPCAPRPTAPDPQPWDAPRDSERADSAPARLAREIAQTIKRMIAERAGVWEKDRLRPMHAGDVLILVRSRGGLFEQLLRALKRAGVPAAGADRLILRDALAVQDLLACAKVALDLGDDLSLACVLKSPFVGLTDDEADLAPLARERAPGERLIERLRAADAARYGPARAFVDGLCARAGEGPFAFLAAILEGLDADGRSGWARLLARLGPDARDPVEELLARALEAGRDGPETLAAFVAAIDGDESELKRELEDAAGAVRVMTVHGAKGLEAPVVFLPDTAGPPKTAPEAGVLPHPDGPILASAQDQDDEAAAATRLALAERAEAEHLRLLYVAMTRARDRLIVCAPTYGKEGVSDRSWHKRLERALAPIAAPCDTPFGPGLRLGAPLTAPEDGAQAGEAAPGAPAWLHRAAPMETAPVPLRPSGGKAAPGLFADRASTRRFGRGRLLHGLLQRLPDLAPALRAQRARAWLAPQGVTGDAAEPLIAEALAVLDDPAFAAVFAPGGRAEASIVGTAFGRPVFGQIDRLVVTREAVLIVDFKSDRAVPAPDAPPEAYVRQLALYRAALAPAFPGLPLRCALLWTAAPRLDPLPEAVLEAALADLR